MTNRSILLNTLCTQVHILSNAVGGESGKYAHIRPIQKRMRSNHENFGAKRQSWWFFTHLFLAGGELGDVGVVALLDVLVGALQDGLLLQAGHCLLLLHAAQAGVGILLAAAEVNAALQFSKLSSRSMPSGSILILIKQGAVSRLQRFPDKRHDKNELLSIFWPIIILMMK